MSRRFCYTLLIITAAFLVFSPISTFALQRDLTIDDIRDLSQDNSSAYDSVKIDVAKKEIELKQAKEGIADVRKSESTIRFSLLFNIKFPEKHGMPKEIELLMKIPTLENELEVLGKQKTYERLKARTSAESAYYDVLLAQYNLDYYQQRLNNSQTVFQKVEKQYKIGEGKKEDVEYVENQLKNFDSSSQKSILTFDTKKEKLGYLINQDIRVGYTFTSYLAETELTRQQLPQIIQYAKDNDFELYKKTQARKLAQTQAEDILDIYKSKYSKYIGDIESYIKSHQGGKIDYEEFLKMYNHTLTQIDSPWAGSYVIKLLFIKIPIPKEWFKGTYSGTRYMEDQKYALFVALADRDKAIKEEEVAIMQLEQSIKNAYSTLKQMEEAVSTTEQNLKDKEVNYNKALDENKLGLISFSSLESIRDDLYTQNQSLYEMKIDYSKALSQFDLTTSGYITNLLTPGSFENKEYVSGDSFSDKASWYIKNTLTEYNFIFGVNIPEEYGVNFYELYYGETKIGDKISINDTIIHVPLTYSDSTLMRVKLYNNNELKYIGYFDGMDYSGELKLEAAKNLVASETAVGTWNLEELDALRYKFSISLEQYDYDSYSVLYKDTVIATQPKSENVQTLKLYFSTIEDLNIKLLKDQKEVKLLYLIKSNDGSNTIVDRH